MGTYPTSPRDAFFTWAKAHAPIFTANAAVIGLSPAQALAFSQASDAANDAESSRVAAAYAAKAATVVVNNRATELRSVANTTVSIIKAYAQATGNLDVYAFAELPPPAVPTPLPEPGQPTNISVSLVPTSGQIELRWKAINPRGAQGTAYIVRRRIGGPTGPFEFIGVTGEKRFVDSTFSAGPDRVEYTIQGQRADSAGPVSDVLLINFGAPGGGGGFTFSTTEATGDAANPKPVKMAA